MAINSKYDYEVTQITPYPKTSPTWFNNLRQLTHDIVGNNDGGLFSVIEITSFTYSTASNQATVSGWAFVDGELVTYDAETVSADNGEYIFATGTLLSPSLTASANIYDVEGALIGKVSDTDNALLMNNRKVVETGYFRHIVNENYQFQAPKTYYPFNHELIATGTYGIESVGAFDIDSGGAITIDSDGEVSIGGSVINITSDAVTTDINLNGNVDISETLDLTGDFRVNTNKLIVTAASGNTQVAGTFRATGAATLSSTLLVNSTSIFSADMTSRNIVPNSTNTYALGHSSKEWSNIYTKIVTATRSIAAPAISASVSASIGALTVSGLSSLNGNVNIGDATSDNIAINGRITADIDPSTTGTRSLGSSTLRWLDIYGSVLNISGASTLTGDVTLGGDLRVNGNDIKSSDGSTAITLSSTAITCPGYSFSSTKTKSLTISAAGFISGDTGFSSLEFVSGKWEFGSTDHYLVGNIVLPHSAVVTSVTVYGNSFNWYLYSNFTGVMASGTANSTDTTINNATISSTFAYYIFVQATSSSGYLSSASITYTILRPDW